MKFKLAIFFKQKRGISFFLTILILAFPLLFALYNILQGGMAFWFDPARDFLLAVRNLEKPTLIGQPTGIPGLFYGPYWLWLISLGLLISKDPKIVTILILALPYIFLFPLLLYQFKKTFSNHKIWLILWLLFFVSYNCYFVSLWNPHLAPLLTLFYLYLFFDLGKKKKKIIFIGFIAGLITNFHFSFGLGIIFGTFLFFLLRFIRELARNIKKAKQLILNILLTYLSFAFGVLVPFIPFIIFELRHGFHQIQALFKTVTNALFYNTATVGVTGLDNSQKVKEIYQILLKLLSLNINEYILLLLIITLVIYFLRLLKTGVIRLSSEEKRLTAVTLTLFSSIVLFYFSSENPVWQYHFIGFEAFFLVLLGILLAKIKWLRIIISLWLVFLLADQMIGMINSYKDNPYLLSSLTTKKYIVDQIYKDSNHSPFVVFVHSPAIYTYDYDYLFYWLGNDKYSYLPERGLVANYPVYLIIPPTSEGIKEDFINYKTPNDRFKTEKEWLIDDGTYIFKRLSI